MALRPTGRPSASWTPTQRMCLKAGGGGHLQNKIAKRTSGPHAHPRPELAEGGCDRCSRGTRRQRRTRRPPMAKRRERPRRATSRARNRAGRDEHRGPATALDPKTPRAEARRVLEGSLRPSTGRATAVPTGQTRGVFWAPALDRGKLGVFRDAGFLCIQLSER